MDGAGGRNSDGSGAAAAGTSSEGSSRHSTGGSESECPVCLQSCMFPLQLPCGHVFCFMCIKGVVLNQNSGCPMCRAVIPITVLTNPVLKEDPNQLSKVGKPQANRPEWYYEGRGGGWWQYDERTMTELEKAFRTQQTCQVLLAGHMYVVDFTLMIQYRLDDPNICRRIKHGTNQEVKGVAGIFMAGNRPVAAGGNSGILMAGNGPAAGGNSGILMAGNGPAAVGNNGILITGNGLAAGGNNGILPPQPPPFSGPVTRSRARRGNPNASGNT